MLNKIKVIGKFLPNKERNDTEYNKKIENEGYYSEDEENELTTTNSHNSEDKLSKTEKGEKKS
jgi:hypothetical protein